MNGEFTEATKKVLAKRAGERCSICSISTSKPSQGNPREFINLGEAAHIYGNNLGKHTRYIESMTNDERCDISNAIWLCRPCHKEIDSDSNKYTAGYLFELKKSHENKTYLGTFDIQWAEKISLQKRIDDLEAIIAEKEKSGTLLDKIYNKELNEVRIERETLRSEKEKLEQSIARLTEVLAGLDFIDPTENTLSLLKYFKTGNLEKLKELLSEHQLSLQEQELARKRLLRANLSEIDHDYEIAEADYKRALDLSPTLEFLESYVGFLTRMGKYAQAIELCKDSLKLIRDADAKVWVNGAIGELFCRSHKNNFAISFFVDALTIIDELLDSNPQRFKLRKAQILSALGTARRNIGQFEMALADFESALNLFWNMSIQDEVTHVEELGNLFNGIGRLYLENNNPHEALIYYAKAEEAFTDIKKDVNLSALYLNKVDALVHPKVHNLVEARRYLDLVKNTLQKQFAENPRSNLELYLGALTKSADNYLMTGNIDRAESEYLEGIRICEDFRNRHGISSIETLAVIHSNYAVLLATGGKKADALKNIDKSIDLLNLFDESELKKHLSLAKSYLFKSEIITGKEERRELIQSADRHLAICGDKVSTKDMKEFIKKKLFELASSP